VDIGTISPDGHAQPTASAGRYASES
jgi:hypothetical protein